MKNEMKRGWMVNGLAMAVDVCTFFSLFACTLLFPPLDGVQSSCPCFVFHSFNTLFFHSLQSSHHTSHSHSHS